MPLDNARANRAARKQKSSLVRALKISSRKNDKNHIAILLR
jgi:hypothetical protein